MVQDKVKNSKKSKSGIPSGMPLPSTRSGKARYISDFYQNSGEKSVNSPKKSPAKSTSSPPPCFGTPLSSKSPTKYEPTIGSPKTPDLQPARNPSSPPLGGHQLTPTSQSGANLVSLPVKTPVTDKALNNKLPPSDQSSAMALLTSDNDPESTPATDGKSEPTLSGANLNPNLGLNLDPDITPDPTLDQNSDHTIGAQALSPSKSSGNKAPSCKPNQSSLDPGLLMSNFQSKPDSLTQALKILRICQTPTSTHSTLPPTNLLPTQNSPSVASSIQLFDSLDTQAQTHPVGSHNPPL